MGRHSLHGSAHARCVECPCAKVLEDSFYKTLTPEQSKLAFANEYDFDAPSSIDFDILVERLRDLKQGCAYFPPSPLHDPELKCV